MRLKKGDPVVVIAGADKGKTGKVLRVLVAEGKVVVQGINLVYKHVRRSQQNPQGGRIQREAPIDVSNVLYFNESTQRGERIRLLHREGRRVRMLAKSQTELPSREGAGR
ncbi:MAG: 50S ribosomal protein L24 [Planctomycetota bacterium]